MKEERTSLLSSQRETEATTATVSKDATAEEAEQEQKPVEYELIDTVDEGIQKTGTCGRFQIFTVFVLICGYMTGELIVQNMAFFELMPQYECYDNESGVWDNCEPEKFCTAERTFDRSMVRVDRDDSHSFHNWVDQLNLTCVEHAKIGLLGTMIFLGWMTSSLVVPRLSDIFGRKMFFLGFQIMQVLSIIAVNYSSSLGAALLSLFCLGFAGVGRSPIVFIYMQEMLTPEYQKLAGPLFATSCALCLVIGTFLLHMVAKNTMMLSYISLSMSIFAVILTTFLLPESPKYLHATGQYEKCRKTLQYMSRVNGTEQASNLENVRFTQEIENQQANEMAPSHDYRNSPATPRESGPTQRRFDQEESKEPLMPTQSDRVALTTGGTGEAAAECEAAAEDAKMSDLWDFNKPYLSNLLIMMLCWQALGFTNTLVSFEMKYLEGDIFINSYTAALAETIAKLGAGVVLVQLGTKPLFAAAFLIAFAGSLNLLNLTEGSDPFLASVFIMMTKFGVSMGWVAACMCLIELFPASLVATAFGLCNVAAKLVCMVAPIVAEVKPPTPMMIVAVITAFAGLLSQKFKLQNQLKEV